MAPNLMMLQANIDAPCTLLDFPSLERFALEIQNHSYDIVGISAIMTNKETIMEMKKVLAGWSKICPGCNIGRKYPDSFIGKKVRNHWEKGCSSHNAYVEVYGSDEPSLEKGEEKSNNT